MSQIYNLLNDWWTMASNLVTYVVNLAAKFFPILHRDQNFRDRDKLFVY